MKYNLFKSIGRLIVNIFESFLWWSASHMVFGRSK